MPRSIAVIHGTEILTVCESFDAARGIAHYWADIFRDRVTLTDTATHEVIGSISPA